MFCHGNHQHIVRLPRKLDVLKDSIKSQCLPCMSPHFEGQNPTLFLQWLSVVRLALLRGAGSQQWSSHSRLGRLSSPSRSPHTRRPPKPRHIFSLRSISAGHTTAEPSPRSGLLSRQVLSHIPSLLMKQPPHPRARRTGARVNTEQMEYFPAFLCYQVSWQ